MRSLPCLLLLAAGVTAQTSIVFPSSHQNIANGASYTGSEPFSAGISRIQLLYEDWDLNLPANTPITRIGFRQDGSQTSVQRLLQLEVRMGTSLLTATTMSSTFDNNFLGASTVVYPLSLFTLPALSSATPNSVVWVNLTTPYTYPGGNLLVEFRVYGNNNGNQSFYYPLDKANFVSNISSGTPGCPHSGSQTPVLTSQPTQIGSNWYLYLSQAPANTAIALFMSAGQQLVPGYSLGMLGLQPSCLGQLPTTGLVSFSASTNSGGGASWTVPVPNNLAFYNFTISSQVVAFDFFSPGYLVVSNGDQVTFGAAPAEGMVYASGSATATTGSAYGTWGIVTLFN